MNPSSLQATVAALSMNGAFFAGLIYVIDRLVGWKVAPRWRRVWWLLLPIAFLLPLPPLISLVHSAPPSITAIAQAAASFSSASRPGLAGATLTAEVFPRSFPWFSLWIGGMALYLLLILWRTVSISRRWSHKRLSTDPALLDLLETCKQESGVTAPIGIVVSEEIGSPALLGWLRPRILLPAAIAAEFTPAQLRSVFFHELAHFKTLDIPLNWAFLVLRAVHWFNPFAHAAAYHWAGVREEAADALALEWLRQPTGEAYGEVLLLTLKTGGTAVSVPFGALAIGETIQHLKRRIEMIRTYSHRRSTSWLGAGFAALLLALIAVAPGRAQVDSETEKKAAIAAMEPWLKELDGGQYAQSWQEASAKFKQAVSSEKWVAAAGNVRAPLGACSSRVLASALYQSGENSLNLPSKGIYVLAQFDASFTNLAQAVETVTFEREEDGVWRASGYFIKPGSTK